MHCGNYTPSHVHHGMLKYLRGAKRQTACHKLKMSLLVNTQNLYYFLVPQTFKTCQIELQILLDQIQTYCLSHNQGYFFILSSNILAQIKRSFFLSSKRKYEAILFFSVQESPKSTLLACNSTIIFWDINVRVEIQISNILDRCIMS